MHDGWSLGGSFNYSYQWNNGSFSNPNTRINAEGPRRAFPGGSSSTARSTSPTASSPPSSISTRKAATGAGRVSVSAPSAWITANNVQSGSIGVTIETPDMRQNVASDNMDFRLEKSFQIGKIGRLGFFVDIFNLFGAQYPSVIMNPAGTWAPTAEGANQSGTFTPASLKVSGISGVENLQVLGPLQLLTPGERRGTAPSSPHFSFRARPLPASKNLGGGRDPCPLRERPACFRPAGGLI